ncbi:MAG: hypothetical protein H6994_10060 [Pseudomonadales bacterium]|nr:hypothetical protein [Pseudomonadales bacterium]
MSEFVPLEMTLDRYFSRKFDRLPAPLKPAVAKQFSLVPWDALSPKQRREFVRNQDQQDDPLLQAWNEFWMDLVYRKDKVTQDMARWDAVQPGSVSELRDQEDRRESLQRELRMLDCWDQSGSRARPSATIPKNARFNDFGRVAQHEEQALVAYPLAMEMLRSRIGATSADVAGWVWLGRLSGGLAAFLRDPEQGTLSRFFFDLVVDESGRGYMNGLLRASFRPEDLETFEPSERFFTGVELVARWSVHAQLPDVEAYVWAKIQHGSLTNCHPIFGNSSQIRSPDDALPPLADGLFLTSEVESIERQELAGQSVSSCGRESKPVVMPEVGTPEWRKTNARKAADALHDQPNGTREKKAKVLKAYEEQRGNFRTKRKFAEWAAHEFHLAERTVLGYLRND